MARRHSQQTLDFEFARRRKHLARHVDAYRRVTSIFFNQMMPRCADIDLCVIGVRYAPRPRVMKIVLGWARSDYPRSAGGFALWRDFIYAPDEIEVWPKAVAKVETKPISDLTDDEVVERILTCVGAPWSNRFPVPTGTGALHHDARHLVHVARGIGSLVPFHHQPEYEDLLRRVQDFSAAVGANLVD